MYRIIIVDDEQWIRRWLTKMIQELREDLAIVGSFEDGEEAYEFLKINEVDIVITDIRMPVMSGLELAEYAKKSKLKTKFIMISGYEEFEYAKKALQLHAVGYLLKPLDKDELKSVIDFAIEALGIKQEPIGGKGNGQAVIAEYLRKLLDDNSSDVDYIVNELHLYKNILIGIVQRDMTIDSKQAIEVILHERLIKMAPNCEHYVIREGHFNYFYFIMSDDSNLIQKDARYIKQKIKEDIEGFSIFQGDWFQKSERICLELMYVRTLMKANNRSVDATDKGHVGRIGRALIILRSNIVINTRTHNAVEVKQNIDKLKEFYFSHNVESEVFRHMLFALMNDMIKILDVSTSETKSILVEKGYDFCVRINKYDNVIAMLDWTWDYIQSIIQFLEKDSEVSVAYIVQTECAYMKEHYNEEISLYSVSEKYGINSSYYSKKFKEEVGMSFVDYLTELRIDAAKELLINTDESVKKIAVDVGYNDSKYFSRVFQTNVGCSPSTYRIKREK